MNTIEIICTILGGFTIIAGGLWFAISKAYNNGINKAKLDSVETKVNTLPCEAHSKDITSHSSIKDTVESNNNLLIEVSKWIMKFDGSMIDKLAKKTSPLKMTKLGQSLYKASGAQKVMDTNIDFLISKLDEKKPTTAYDVENEALIVLMQNIGHELFNDIKNYIYNAPEEIEIFDEDTNSNTIIKLSMPNIIKLMSINLRDEYLKRNSNIIK